MAHPLARAAEAAFSLVLPPRCPGCGVVVDADGRFCAECFMGLVQLGPPWCARCGEPFAEAVEPDTVCERCAAEPPAFAAARGAVAYEDPARRMVLKLKHGDATHLAEACAAQMRRAGADWLQPPAVVVPVPLWRWRLWRRGYNQAALIARSLARRTGLPLLLDGLVRIRSTPASGGLTRAERYANVAGAFAVNRPDELAGRPVVLIDDVITAGATAHACALALSAAGAGPVNALAFARVVQGARPAH
jgi:ComF family protein